MTKIDFAAQRKAAEREGLISSSDYFKIREGTNRIRLLSECLPHPGEFNGKKNFKWLAYVLDRSDGQVKPFFMPNTIYRQIEALQQTEDYAFDSVPMPYDISINAVGAGTMEVKYSVVPARKNLPLTAEEEKAFAEKKPIDELQDALFAKNEHKERPLDVDGKFDPDEIPF